MRNNKSRKTNGKTDKSNQIKVIVSLDTFDFFLELRSFKIGWVNWGEWSVCSETCGSGVKQRTRACNSTYPANDCPGSILMIAYCNSGGCITNGRWSVWSVWDICQPTSGSTGAGTQTRTRSCMSPSLPNEGNACEGEAKESKACIKGDPVDGEWGSYSGWSDCDLDGRNCGDNGERWQERNCVDPKPRFGGIPCNGSGIMHEACNIDCTSAIELRLTGLWGTTGLQEECPNGHFVTAFKTKMSLNQGITGVRLQCNDPSQEEIHSLEHPDGSYGEFVLSCPGGYTKIKGKFHPNQPDG
ncbi:hypothetical protein TCAL_13760, partial [Tigriopus californicus]